MNLSKNPALFLPKAARPYACSTMTHGVKTMAASLTGERGKCRGHRKSRAGCLGCKKRRVKCDENHPTCQKCAIGNRACVYCPSASRSESRSSKDTTETPLTVGGESATSRTPASPWNRLRDRDPGSDYILPGFTALHLHLFHHATTNMASYTASEGITHLMITYALDNASTAPYLLNQLLALSALHCSTVKENDQIAFAHEARKLQTRALSHFNDVDCGPNEHTGITSFMFVSLLGIHTLYNTLSAGHRDIGDFTTSFVGYMRIHRGVRPILDEYWTRISRSEPRSLFYIMDWIETSDTCSFGREPTLLRKHLESLPDRSTSSVQACLEALGWIQWVLNLKATVADDSERRVHASIAWPLIVSEEYVESLRQHKQEALAVLAFFMATLHQKPHFWGFNNAGPQLVSAIVAHVGPLWEDALTWPREAVACQSSGS